MTLNIAKACCPRYKKDTEIIELFLKGEGTKFNCPDRYLKAPEPITGKQCQYVLRLYNFKHIANHLATQDTFSVPAHIMAYLDSAMNLRTKCNRIHEKQCPKETAANMSHKHAIEELMDVRRILLPKLAAKQPDADAEMQKLPGKH